MAYHTEASKQKMAMTDAQRALYIATFAAHWNDWKDEPPLAHFNEKFGHGVGAKIAWFKYIAADAAESAESAVLYAEEAIAVLDERFCPGNESAAMLRDALGLEPAPQPECTGVSAKWCPRCGDCTCPTEEYPDCDCLAGMCHCPPLGLCCNSCPLHAFDSPHAENEDGEKDGKNDKNA